jgi:hypothetical protein
MSLEVIPYDDPGELSTRGPEREPGVSQINKTEEGYILPGDVKIYEKSGYVFISCPLGITLLTRDDGLLPDDGQFKLIGITFKRNEVELGGREIYFINPEIDGETNDTKVCFPLISGFEIRLRGRRIGAVGDEEPLFTVKIITREDEEDK